MIDNALRSLLIDAALAKAEDSEKKEYSPSDRFKITLNKNLKSRGMEPFYSFFAIKRRRALAVIAAAVTALALTMSVGAIRERVVSFFVEMFDSFAVITAEKIDTYPNKIEQQYAPSYIPEGFTQKSILVKYRKIDILMSNKNGDEIGISQFVQGVYTFIDAEKRVEFINVFGENDGVLWESRGIRSIYFEYNKYFFEIYSQPEISEEELIRIAKSLEKTN